MRVRIAKYVFSWVVLIFVLGLAGFAIISLTPSPAPAAPKIIWNPGSLTQTILAGDSVVVPVSFTASEYLSDVVVRVVPELQQYVQVNPAAFAGIAAGETVNVDVTISAPVRVKALLSSLKCQFCVSL